MKNIEYDIPIFESNDLADLDLYSEKMATAIKEQIDKFGNPLAFKGIKQNISELDLISNPQSGDIYGVIETNKNYIWNGKEWIIYSDIMELDNYYNKEEINQKIENIQALPTGGTKGQVLTKQSETDGDANWEDIEANEVFVGAEEPTTGEKVWFRKGKNKFNPNDKTNGYLNINGSFTSATDWTCSGFIEINSNKYILSANATATRVIWCEYDSSMNIIGTRHEVAYGNPIAIVSTNTKYIKVCFNDGTATDIQLEQGTTATIYEAYVEDKFFIKNASGNYEEFMKKEEQIYSTEEQRIGIWNGKKLYRKTIEVDTSSSFTNSTLTKYEHKISNIEKIIKATSTAKTSWGGGWFTDITLAINKFQIRADETYLYIKNDSGSDYKLEYLAVILEYTKTTD